MAPGRATGCLFGPSGLGFELGLECEQGAFPVLYAQVVIEGKPTALLHPLSQRRAARFRL